MKGTWERLCYYSTMQTHQLSLGKSRQCRQSYILCGVRRRSPLNAFLRLRQGRPRGELSLFIFGRGLGTCILAPRLFNEIYPIGVLVC